jgi:pyruvate-ferredoxin/flavodoxin oxidoreductase
MQWKWYWVTQGIKMTDSAKMIICDGSEAAARIAYKVSEVCAIYPITPSSSMAELADQWSAEQQCNIWHNVPLIIEMQSEGGAAGAVHGALQSGALTTTFTASQGLLLMLPNMYKIAGELTATVFHVAARSLAAQGLSIFGDHQDVMAARFTGFAQLASSSVQETQDMAIVAHAATLESRIPFIHFFDGFRTSHEMNKIALLPDEVIVQMISDDLVRAHRERGLRPDHPFIRGTAQNPDVYFQGRETVNPFYEKVPKIVARCMDKLAELTGRSYKTIEYFGALDAKEIIVSMGSSVETIKETIDYLNQKGEKVGVIQVRLYRPLPSADLLAILPKTVEKIAVLDRTKEAGSGGEPLYQDILTCLAENMEPTKMPKICGGRYGLSSKEFTPAMVKAVFENLKKSKPKNHFTVGIVDDVSYSNLTIDEHFDIEPKEVVRAVFYGLGSDGTVGANKNTIKIIGQEPDYFAQGYFVYDSKKAGSQTVSHLRFGHQPIKSPYLIQSANFIACHQHNFLKTTDMLTKVALGATFLLNTPKKPEEIWWDLPYSIRQSLIKHQMKFYIVDAYKVAKEAGMGRRINTVMQACFFALSHVMSSDKAIKKIKQAIEKTYAKKGKNIIDKNFLAVDSALANLIAVPLLAVGSPEEDSLYQFPNSAPEFVKHVTAKMLMGQGDSIPVSLMPVDGTYPSATTRWEKRTVAQEIPIWDKELCIQCGNCSFVCPHAAIRAKFYDKSFLDNAPEGFKASRITARGFPDTYYTLQVYPEDCTGCTLCVNACPKISETNSNHKAINMEPIGEHLEQEKRWVEFFEMIPYNNRSRVDFSNVRGVQFLEPLFEFSSACAGCGETPYLKLITQLFGDRLMVANATGCSSIYGGNLPTTPWSKNKAGRGPAWSNSLFEDNAEFGLGFRLAAIKHQALARQLLLELSDKIGQDLTNALLNAHQRVESEIQLQIARVEELKRRLKLIPSNAARHLESVADQLIRRSIWIVGGDGWAYDIGSSGLDHVLASGADVNILVMDTEVYSNTGGQTSKSTPLGAVARFASAGKSSIKKDLAMQAIAYGNVYVARIAFGADPQQSLLAIQEAEAYVGASLVIAYSHCIAHGIDMEKGLLQQKLSVKSGHWPLMRYNPELRHIHENPFSLDSLRPTIPLSEYRYNENRFRLLKQVNPTQSDQLLIDAQNEINQRWQNYEELSMRNMTNINPHMRSV